MGREGRTVVASCLCLCESYHPNIADTGYVWEKAYVCVCVCSVCVCVKTSHPLTVVVTCVCVFVIHRVVF